MTPPGYRPAHPLPYQPHLSPGLRRETTYEHRRHVYFGIRKPWDGNSEPREVEHVGPSRPRITRSLLSQKRLVKGVSLLAGPHREKCQSAQGDEGAKPGYQRSRAGRAARTSAPRYQGQRSADSLRRSRISALVSFFQQTLFESHIAMIEPPRSWVQSPECRGFPGLLHV
jgi:hypothetical protein